MDGSFHAWLEERGADLGRHPESRQRVRGFLPHAGVLILLQRRRQGAHGPGHDGPRRPLALAAAGVVLSLATTVSTEDEDVLPGQDRRPRRQQHRQALELVDLLKSSINEARRERLLGEAHLAQVALDLLAQGAVVVEGQDLEADLLGSDRDADIAVLKVNAPASVLHPLSFGDSTTVGVGDGVLVGAHRLPGE